MCFLFVCFIQALDRDAQLTAAMHEHTANIEHKLHLTESELENTNAENQRLSSHLVESQREAKDLTAKVWTRLISRSLDK